MPAARQPPRRVLGQPRFNSTAISVAQRGENLLAFEQIITAGADDPQQYLGDSTSSEIGIAQHNKGDDFGELLSIELLSFTNNHQAGFAP